MRRRLKWILPVLILAAAAVIVPRLLSRTAKEPQVLATAEIKIGDVKKILEATGIIKAQVGAVVKIGARATGTIKEMNVRVGQPVKKGEIIARIDDREDQARLAEAKAKLAQAEAEAAEAEAVYPKRVAEAQANLELAQAKRDYAKANLARQRQLFALNLIARDAMEQAKRDALVSNGETLAQEASLTRLETEFEKARIKTRKAVEEAKAVLNSAETRLSYAQIVSPIDGVVANVTSQEGETVVAGLQVANLITVLDPSRLEMWIYVDETDVGQIHPGQKTTFQVDAYPDVTFGGRVDQIYPQPELRDNIVYYQALVRLDPEESSRLRPEMTTRCRIVVEEKSGVPVIPNEALKWAGSEQVVYLVAPDGKAVPTHPELGLAGLDETEVTSGLSPGQKVATKIVLPGAAKDKPKRPESRP